MNSYQTTDPAKDDLALTFIQRDVLAEASLDPAANPHLRRAVTSGVTGLTPERVTEAWRSALVTYPFLGTRIVWRGGEPRRMFDAPAPHCEVALPDDDDRFLDPESGHLVRLCCVAEDTGTHAIILTYHRLVLDDTAAEIMLEEVLHRALGEAPTTLASTPDSATASVDDATAAFWERELSPINGTIPLLFDHPTTYSPHWSELAEPLSSEVDNAFDRLVAEHNVPPALVLAAAWSIVAAIFRGDPDVVVGVKVDCRPAGAPHALGSFEHVLPLVSRIDGTKVAQWLAQRIGALADVVQHRAITGDRINAAAGTNHSVALFDSVVDLRPERPSRLNVGVSGGELVPMTVGLDLSGERSAMTAVVDEDRVDKAYARALLQHAARVIVQLAMSGDAAVNQINALDTVQRRHILEGINATTSPYPAHRCLHQLVEDQVDRTPDAPAIVFGSEVVCYREVDCRSNRLAHLLRRRGAGRDSLIGLCMEPSVDLVVAILAILKSGGAYVPLDPTSPAARIAHFVREIDPSMIVAQASTRKLLPTDHTVVQIDDPLIRDEPETRPYSDVSPRNLAYVMYTSGSTGEPKGVMVEHRGIVNFVWWMARFRPLEASDSCLNWTAYSFDAAVRELFWPLIVGARAVIAPPDLHLDLDAFVQIIRSEQITMVQFVPATLQLFVSAPDAGGCTSLRYVFSSGEPMPDSVVERFHALFDAELINLYGTTEVSIDSTFHVTEPDRDSPVPAGRPLANSALYVLDHTLEPVPVGARGEVYLGGDSVTRGYLGRRAATADRFRPDPVRPGGRIYRTGDLGTLLPDGQLLFLGRNDHQVKIRGLRINVLEVEAALERHTDVKESLVITSGAGTDRFLAAYVVRRSGSTDENDLREHLSQELPSYMVPSVVIALSGFPLGKNRKVNRQALPIPELATPDEDSVPRPGTEQRIAAIWSDLLRRDGVGSRDDFHSLGGSSLQLTRLVAELRRKFGDWVPTRLVLDATTVAGQAVAVDRHLRSAATAEDIFASIADLDDAEVERMLTDEQRGD